MPTKTCIDCGQTLPLTSFYRHRGAWRPRCKACHDRRYRPPKTDRLARLALREAKRTNQLPRGTRLDGDRMLHRPEAGECDRCSCYAVCRALEAAGALLACEMSDAAAGVPLLPTAVDKWLEQLHADVACEEYDFYDEVSA